MRERQAGLGYKPGPCERGRHLFPASLIRHLTPGVYVCRRCSEPIRLG